MTDAAELARGWFEHSPFIRNLGLRLVALEADRAEVELPYAEHLPTMGDVVHGGAISGLVDTTAALAAWSGHDVSEGTRWGTAGLSINFLAAGRGQALRATARVKKRGRSLCFIDVDVENEAGNPVAGAMVTYRLG